MSAFRLPRCRVLAKTNLNHDYHHSILIGVLRGLAAVEVAAAHLRAQIFPGLKGMADPALWYQALAFFTGFAHHAVVVFFLLSGWLVGGSLLNKLSEPHVMRSYVVDRMTRLWIVLIPAFVLSLFIGAYTGAVDPGTVSYAARNEFSVISFLGNLFGLQDMAVPRFGDNFPLWSLANETWYYALFPLMVVPFMGRSPASRIASIILWLLVASSLSFEIMLYFPIWLLGVMFSRIEITASSVQRWLVAVALLGITIYQRMTGSTDKLTEESFVQDLIFSLPFLLLLASLQFKADSTDTALMWIKKVGTLFAGFSFTLYVIHVPFLILLRNSYSALRGQSLSAYDMTNLGVYLVMLTVILVLSYLFHLPFEAQTHRVRSFIKGKLMGSRSQAPAPVRQNV